MCSLPECAIPYGFCHCGCGARTALAKSDALSYGHQKGEPLPYLKHHRLKAAAKTRQVVLLAQREAEGWQCRCGCGQIPPQATNTDILRGRIKSYPTLYIQGHQTRTCGGKRAKRKIGDRRLDPTSDYVHVYQPDHPHAAKNGRVLEHRLVMEQKLGRLLTPEERVHHIGTLYPQNDVRNRSDNRPENLQLLASDSEHTLLHHAEACKLPRSWAPMLGYEECRTCHSPDRKHFTRGYCKPCYFRLYFARQLPSLPAGKRTKRGQF